MNESEKSINQAIGTRIRNARIMRGLSQQQLAGQLGIATQQQQKYEKGVNNINAFRLLAIAGALNVSAAHLLGEDNHPLISASLPRQKFIHLIRALKRLEADPVLFDKLHNMVTTLATSLHCKQSSHL